MREINWPEVVIGVTLGLVPLLVRQIYLYFRYMRSPGRKKYIGDWWHYWRSSTGSGQIRQARLSIRYSFVRNRLVVRYLAAGVLHGGGALEYAGYVTERRGMVRYLYLKDRNSHIEETWCLIDPFYDPFDSTQGVSVTLDLRGLPVGTPFILSHAELEKDELEKKLAQEVIRTDPLKDMGLPSRGGNGGDESRRGLQRSDERRHDSEGIEAHGSPATFRHAP